MRFDDQPSAIPQKWLRPTPELIEKLNRLQDENYHKLILATFILEAADSNEKESAKLQERLSKSKMQAGVDYFPPISKLVIY